MRSDDDSSARPEDGEEGGEPGREHSQGRGQAPDVDGPLPNRLTRGTLVGCLGILGVLAMPALLFLPLEIWAPPTWVALLVPLVAFGAAAAGAWLLARVPSSVPPRSDNPIRPLTTAGAAPLLERPARPENRWSLAVAGGLMVCAAAGFVLAARAGVRQRGLLAGIGVSGVAGGALVLDAVLVAGRRAATPALRWVRSPIQEAFARQGIPLALVGLVCVVWALWVATGAGYAWGAAGLAALTLGGVLAAPLTRRLPTRGRDDGNPEPRSEEGSARRE